MFYSAECVHIKLSVKVVSLNCLLNCRQASLAFLRAPNGLKDKPSSLGIPKSWF